MLDCVVPVSHQTSQELPQLRQALCILYYEKTALLPSSLRVCWEAAGASPRNQGKH